MSASVPQTKLRMDKSRPFGTVHGERAPGDKHQFAHFQQDGIYYDAHGLHLEELVEDDKTRALVERRLKRQAKAAPKEKAADAGDSDNDEDLDPASNGAGSDSSDDVNLEAWLRGEAQYHWFRITKLVRERYHQNITKLIDMIEFLVEDEKVITVSELAPEYAKLLKPQAA
jgi:hypothetical protein